MYFSSGPCKKPYTVDDPLFDDAGRSHRSKFWIQKIQKNLINLKKILKIPEEYLIAFVPGSASGAIEMLLWNLLGANSVDIIDFDPFSSVWRHDIINELKIKPYRIIQGNHLVPPKLDQVSKDNDIVFVYNGTPNGMQVPNLDWIANNDQRLVISDATSAVFCTDIDWKKLDAVGFSLQKGLGTEAGIGIIALSPKAVERLKTYHPERPIPRVFRLKNNQQIDFRIFEGYTINTPSLIGLNDLQICLDWANGVGGLPALIERTENNFKHIVDWISDNRYCSFFVQDENWRSKISPCILIDKFIQREDYLCLTEKLEKERKAYDIKGHDLVSPCIRIWCGPTIEVEELKTLTKHLDEALCDKRDIS